VLLTTIQHGMSDPRISTCLLARADEKWILSEHLNANL